MSGHKPIIHETALAVLKVIAACHPSVSNADLEDLTGYSKSGIEYALRRLEEAGCIERRGNKRARILVLTARGRGCLGGHVRVQNNYQRPTQRLRHRGEAKQRSCRMCLKDFGSEGPGHRICDPCRASAEWRSSAAGHHVCQEVR